MYNNEWRIIEIKLVHTTIAICGVKIEHSRLKSIKPMKNSSLYTDLVVLVMGILMREISKLGWLIVLVVGRFLVCPVPAVTFNA
jgi:hypothetical protein